MLCPSEMQYNVLMRASDCTGKVQTHDVLVSRAVWACAGTAGFCESSMAKTVGCQQAAWMVVAVACPIGALWLLRAQGGQVPRTGFLELPAHVVHGDSCLEHLVVQGLPCLEHAFVQASCHTACLEQTLVQGRWGTPLPEARRQLSQLPLGGLCHWASTAKPRHEHIVVGAPSSDSCLEQELVQGQWFAQYVGPCYCSS